jgi:monoamine oxidase
MSEELEADVAIVGAGLAGLVAARQIIAAGARPLVLEARGRVGGRVLNEEIGDGKVVEVGGQWIGPTQDRLAALAAELGVGTFPTYDRGRHLIEVGGRRASYTGALTDARLGLVRELSKAISPLALADFELARMRLDRMAKRVPLEEPWAAPKASEWDAQTFATWLGRNTRTAAARTLFELATEAVWAAEPADVSFLHVLFYTRSGSGFNTLLGTDGGAQQDRFHGGSQRIPLLLTEQLGDERLRLGAPVRRIAHGAGDVTVEADGPGGEPRGLRLRAQRAIVAVPPTLARRIAYDPPLPGLRDQLTQRMPQGTVIKTMAIYEEPFWRQAGLSGQAAGDVGPARVVFDNSPPDGSPGVLLGFLEGRLAREWGARPADERRRAILGGHTRLFGARAARPERFIERVWAEEEWTRGCYGCLMTTGGWTEYGRALRAPIGRLHWAGAETATRWSGYMDGAVQSGERAAAEALAALP